MSIDMLELSRRIGGLLTRELRERTAIFINESVIGYIILGSIIVHYINYGEHIAVDKAFLFRWSIYNELITVSQHTLL